MEIKYPIFLRDKDNYMYIITSPVDINRELEFIDIEEKEYEVWDVRGRPLEFYIEHKEIKVKSFSNNLHLKELEEAILNYVKIAKPKSPFIYSGPKNNMFELFKAIEKHINKEK